MKKLLVMLMLIMGVSLTACSNDTSLTQDKSKEETAKEDDKSATEEVKREYEGVTFKIGDKELEFPYDFTQNNLLLNGFTRNSSVEGYEIPVYDDSGQIDVEYSNGLTVEYIADDVIYHGVDSLYITGFRYDGDDIKVIGGIPQTEPENPDSDMSYSNNNYTLNIHKSDGKVTGMALDCTNPDRFFQFEKLDWDEFDIPVYECDKMYDSNVYVTYETARGEELFPSTEYIRNRMYTNIPLNIGFTSDNPSLILQKTDEGEQVIGMLFTEKGDKVGGIRIGSNLYDTMSDLGVDFKDDDNFCVRFTADNSLADIFIQCSGNEISHAVVVSKSYLETVETQKDDILFE